MSRYLFLAVVSLFLSSRATAADFNYEDCIISGMKGVQSDVAAGQVRMACRAKETEAASKREDAMRKKYGEPVDIDSLQMAPSLAAASDPGFQGMVFTNKNPDKTITVVRLNVQPAMTTGAICDATKAKDYFYKVTIKPLQSGKLVFPLSTLSGCITPMKAVGRTPSWTDVSFASEYKPLSKAELDELN